MAIDKTLANVGAAALAGLKPNDVQEEDVVELTPEEAEALREQKIAKLTQVLSRGVLNDKLHSLILTAVPKGRVGKLVRDRDEDIIRHSNLGYTFEVVPGAQGLHATADGRVRVGDLVLMTISQEDHELLVEIRRRGIRRKLDLAKNEAKARMQEDGIPVIDDSRRLVGRN